MIHAAAVTELKKKSKGERDEEMDNAEGRGQLQEYSTFEVKKWLL